MDGASEICMESPINRESSALISHHAHRPAFVQLVLPLDDFVLRLSYICRESKSEILGYALLHPKACRGIRIVPANQRIDLQPGYARQFADVASNRALDLADPLRQNRTGSQARRPSLCGLPASNEVNDVDRRQRRVGYVAGLKFFDRARKPDAEIV